MLKAELHETTGLPMVTEDRKAERWRSLPRSISERLKAMKVDSSARWTPDYQLYDGLMRTGLLCWKCARPLMGWMPALTWDIQKGMQRREGERPEMTKTVTARPLMIGGKPAVHLAHYEYAREGIYRYRRFDHAGTFTFLICAECRVKDEDGEKLLAIFLAGQDDEREVMRQVHQYPQKHDDAWASFMTLWRPELTDLIGIDRILTLEDIQKGPR